MKKMLETLQTCVLFRGIEAENIQPLLGCLNARTKTFEKRETILAEGSPARWIGVVLEGTAQIAQVDYYGNRSIVGGVGTGDVFGEAFACAGVQALPVTVAANEACRVLLIDCQRILHPCQSACGFHQQLITNLMQTLAMKNILFHQKSEIASKRTTRDKLMTYLMQQAKKTGSNCFDIPFDRQELADYLQVDRSGLSVQISRLCKEGVIRSRRKHFELL